MLIFLFILAFTIKCKFVSNDTICIEKMRKFQNLSLDEQIQIVLPYYVLSGDWIQKYGYYDRCLRNDNGYSSVKVDQGLYKLGYGFCHSLNCSATDFNSDEGQSIIKKILNNSGLADLLQINITTTSLTFYNPQTYYPEIGWGTYITCAILIILFIMISIDPLQRFKYAYNSKHTPDVRDQITSRRGSRISPLGLREDLQVKQLYTPTTIIKDFSIILNYEKIMNLKTIDPNLAIFNGIRAISFMMVVYGHVCEMTAASTYIQEVNLQYKKWSIILLYDMMYAVDIFFWMGGFFLGYVMCDQRKVQNFKKSPIFSVIWSIIHRLMRIWPSYLICIAINSYIIPHLGSGPRWFQNEGATTCPGGAWKNALFIDNFFEDWKICFGWGWYLTCDFQLFLTCLIPIIFYCNINKVFSKIFIILMIISSLGWGYYVSIHYDFFIPAKNTYNLEHYYKYYVSTYARAPPYFLGLLIGILYREFKQSKKGGDRTYLQQFKDYASKTGQRYILQFFCYGIGFSLFYFFFFDWKKEFNSLQPKWSKEIQYIYNATCRFLLTFGLTLIALPNLIGINDIFNRKFMNNTLFKFMAKISFTMYLVHLMFIVILTETFYETPSFYQIDMIAGFICTLILSIIFGLLLSLLLELPFGNLDNRLMKIIIRPTKKVNTLLD